MPKRIALIFILIFPYFFIYCYASPVLDPICNPSSEFDANLPAPITNCQNVSFFQPLLYLLLGQTSASTTTSGIELTQSGSGTNVTEAGGTDTYTIKLMSAPNSAVSIEASGDSQILLNGLSTATLTFDTNCPGSNCWSTIQTLTVSAVNDDLEEGIHDQSISHTVSSNDTGYDKYAISPVIVSIQDDDAAGVTITESGGSTSVTEAGGTDTYTVVLTSQPTSSVNVTVTVDAQTRVNGGATATLTFTIGNWNTTQTVTVSAVDDSTTEGNHSGTISHSATSSDASYNGISIPSLTVSIVENDFLSSSVPSNNATNVSPCSGNPCRGSIVLSFDQSMNASLTPTLVTEVADSTTPTYIDVPNTNTTFVWTSNSFANDTLTINISWYWFPSNSLIRYTLNNLQSAAAINSGQIQQIFTTTGVSQAFGVPDNGNTSCSNMTTTTACSDIGTWPRQDRFFVNTPSAPSYTGPTIHGTYTTDRRTIDDVTGIVWKTCVEGETGASCTGTANSYTWENALNACSALNIANSGVGYWGLTTWRLASSRELDTLPRFGTAGTPNTTAFPGSPATFGWTNMGFLSNRSQAWTTFFVNYQNSASQGKSSLNHVRCVASPALVNATSYTDLGDGTISDNRSNLIWQKCSNGQGNITTTCSGAATASPWDVNLQYCRNLNLAGRSWRMPSILELRSILDRSLSTRVFDPAYFPNSSPGQYASSSTWLNQRDSKFMVQGSDGNSYANPKTANGVIRCVSTGP